MNKLSSVSSNHVIKWFHDNEVRILHSFKEILSCDTSLGKEKEAFPLIEKYISQVGFISRREAIHPDTKSSAFFSPHPLSDIGEGRENLRARLDMQALGTDSVLFSCHIDVVPETSDFPQAFSPHYNSGKVHGRGACDTKNNLVMLVEAIRFIREHNLTLSRRVYLDMPIEEEIGGNGALSTILHGIDASSVIVLEPTSLKVFRGHRGCVTVAIEITGQSVHMGGDSTGISAIKAGMNVIEGLELFEQKLLGEARKNADFNVWSRPLQLNIGLIKGGEWAGSVPEKCTLTCNLGFLPEYTIEQIEKDIRQAVLHSVSHLSGIKVNFDFHCGIRNDAYIQSHNSPLVLQLQAAVDEVTGEKTESTHGWCVSCDARYYDKVAHLPVVIFGAGELTHAHSAHENIELNEIAKGTAILVNFLTSHA